MQDYPREDHPDFRKRARSCLEEGRYALALDLARERLIRDPEDIDAAIVLCRSWLGLGKLEEAAAAFAAIEPRNRELARLLKLLGDAHRLRGDNHRAVNYYQRSMALLPDMAELREVQIAVTELVDEDGGLTGDRPGEGGFQTLTMAELYIRQGQDDEAREILRAILARDPDHEEARQRLAGLTELTDEKNNDLPIDKKTTVVHELSRWLGKLNEEEHEGR